jgi:hypothetical protein
MMQRIFLLFLMSLYLKMPVLQGRRQWQRGIDVDRTPEFSGVAHVVAVSLQRVQARAQWIQPITPFLSTFILTLNISVNGQPAAFPGPNFGH